MIVGVEGVVIGSEAPGAGSASATRGGVGSAAGSISLSAALVVSAAISQQRRCWDTDVQEQEYSQEQDYDNPMYVVHAQPSLAGEPSLLLGKVFLSHFHILEATIKPSLRTM